MNYFILINYIEGSYLLSIYNKRTYYIVKILQK